MPNRIKYFGTIFTFLSLLVFHGINRDVLANENTDPFHLLVHAVGSTADTSVQAALLKGMLLGLEGRRSVHAPEGWPALSNTLACSTSAPVRQHALALSQIFGDNDGSCKCFGVCSRFKHCGLPAMLNIESFAWPAESRGIAIARNLNERSGNDAQCNTWLCNGAK